MTVADEDNPMFNDAYRKKLREEKNKKSPLRPMSVKELKEAFGRKKDTGRKVSPYVRFKNLNQSDEEISIKPKPAVEVGIKISF